MGQPDGSVIPPARFIDLAEDTGRIDAITWQQIETALSEMRPVLASNAGFRLSFNVSPQTFLAPDFARRLTGTVAKSDAAPHQVTVELTERLSFPDPDRASEIIGELQQLGFAVAIDDVGIGHNGLSQIHRLGAKSLKVDKFFVDAIHEDGGAPIVIEMLVRLARERGMTLVAEGVEREDQAAALLGCGVRIGQGYILSPPVPGVKFLAFYGRHRDGAQRPWRRRLLESA